MEVPVNNALKDKIKKDKHFKPKTPPQIDENAYCKWITDKYNKKCDELDKVLNMLQAARHEIRDLKKAADSRRLKYMNEMNEFSSELMKDATILKYKREIDNQNKAIKRLRNSIDTLIAENNKLKNK